jgi:putative transposase
MPRNPRCVLPSVAHHVTQRGVDRADVFYCQSDRQTYLHLLEDNIEEAAVRVLAWTLMTNHVHLVLVPEREDSLEVLMRRVAGRYAQYLNARTRRSGHLWERRFFSCPVDPRREELVIRYVEWNPVRAEMVECPEQHRWSSAAAHLTGPEAESFRLLDWNYWTCRGGAARWRDLLARTEDPREWRAVRRATYAGAPLGTPEFQQDVEQWFGRKWRQPGRPRRREVSSEMGTQPCATFSVA